MPIENDEVKRVGVYGAEKRMLASRTVRAKGLYERHSAKVYVLVALAGLAVAAAVALLK